MLTANQAEHADVHTSPGKPRSIGALNDHAAALKQSLTELRHDQPVTARVDPEKFDPIPDRQEHQAHIETAVTEEWRALPPDEKYRTGALLPAEAITEFYDTQVAATGKGAVVLNPRFQLGALASDTVSRLSDILGSTLTGVARISGRAIKHIEDQRPKRAKELILSVADLLQHPDDVLPSQNPGRALLVKAHAIDSDGSPHAVTVVEVERAGRGIDVVSIYTTNDKGLRKLRETPRPEGRQPPSESATSPHPPLDPRQAMDPHAAAEFPTVDRGEASIADADPDLQMAAQALDETPDLAIPLPDADGNLTMVSAREELARIDAEIAQAERDAPAYLVAAQCFLRSMA